MTYVAHTPPKENPELPPHPYADHIKEMVGYGYELLRYILAYSSMEDDKKNELLQTFTAVLMLHDMGKLDEENQDILQGRKKGKLPIDHIDAGVAAAAFMGNELAAWLIRGHHAPGLPSKKTEKYFIQQLVVETGHPLTATSLRGLRYKRSKEEANLREDYLNHLKAIRRTDEKFDDYREEQLQAYGDWPKIQMHLPDNGLIIRLLLSCLVDSDHGSSAAYASGTTLRPFIPPENNWEKRLVALGRYVENFPKATSNSEQERNMLREELFRHCRDDALFESCLVMCSASVGLGKTTSVMAYLLRKAMKHNATRVIVIAPFSNIINQTVKVLRRAVVLKGEDPEKTVVAHHHKVDFSDKDMRQYTVLWRAPIVVTTAVQFFETLASADPTKLRRLHAVAGSCIFIDESHACLPVELLNISWYWLTKLTDEWGCNIVFSSGSMVEFWNDAYLIDSKKQKVQKLQDIFSEELRNCTDTAETKRIEFVQIENALSVFEIIEKIQNENSWKGLDTEQKPSCLVIMNTVQSAAIVAYNLAKKLNESTLNLKDKKVLHLSTALTPKDRDVILEEIERRQGNSEWSNKHWYLIATSCVEAGVDLDFSIGFRERCSVAGFLQAAGRINRHGLRSSGILYDFTVIPEDGLNRHPGFTESSIVFYEMWNDIKNRKIDTTEMSTTSLRKEFSRFPQKRKTAETMLEQEQKLNFQEVSKDYRVIASETATVIVSKEIVEKLRKGIPIDWRTIQENSVQLWFNKINKLHLVSIDSEAGIYSWVDTYEYDPIFLGIMYGLINVDDFFKNGGVCF